MQVLFSVPSLLQVLVPVDSLSFPLVVPTFKLHRKRDDIVDIFAVIARSDNLLPAHWTLWGALAWLGTLVFTRYEGFHETCMAEQMTLMKTTLVFARETV